MMEMKMKYCVLFVLISAALGLGGCTDNDAGYPGYGAYNGPAPYYGSPYYGPGPYYGGGSVVVAVGDRPYYRGPGYWSGRTYYVWRQGHWAHRNGQRIWRPGHYVVRGY